MPDVPNRPDPPDTLRDWEPIQVNGPEKTERLKILSGWLYRTVIDTGQVAMVFVPNSREDE